MTAETDPKISPLAAALATHNNLKKLVPVAQRLADFLAAGDRYLADAQRAENSEGVRADCACDAAYMFARVALRGADESLEHPTETVLWAAAEELGWHRDDVAPAAYHLFGRYATPRADEREGERYDSLMALATRLKEAVKSE